MSDCNLLYITDALYFVLKEYQITKCNVKNNGMKKFPKKMIEKFPTLMRKSDMFHWVRCVIDELVVVLNLEGNKLEELPSEMGRWTDLRALNLAKNNFKAFPNVLLELETLQFLDVGDNEIEGRFHSRI